jgi:hypothetical protein
LTIFVDALDECDKNQAAGMICFFKELCHHAREVQVRLQIASLVGIIRQSSSRRASKSL